MSLNTVLRFAGISLTDWNWCCGLSTAMHGVGQNTRSSAVAVIADRTASTATVRLAEKLITAWFLFLTLFAVIAASRPVNKNVNIIGAVIRAKPGTEPGVHKLLANYQTGFVWLGLQTAGIRNLILPGRVHEGTEHGENNPLTHSINQ